MGRDGPPLLSTSSLPSWPISASAVLKDTGATNNSALALPVFSSIPPKLVKRLLEKQYVEMWEMLLETWQLEAELTCCHAKHPKHSLVMDISVWMECFATIAAVLSSAYPDEAPHFFAYLRTSTNCNHTLLMREDRKSQSHWDRTHLFAIRGHRQSPLISLVSSGGRKATSHRCSISHAIPRQADGSRWGELVPICRQTMSSLARRAPLPSCKKRNVYFMCLAWARVEWRNTYPLVGGVGGETGGGEGLLCQSSSNNS